MELSVDLIFLLRRVILLHSHVRGMCVGPSGPKNARIRAKLAQSVITKKEYYKVDNLYRISIEVTNCFGIQMYEAT